MTVLVGYVPNAIGAAAVDFGIEEARRRGEPVVVLNTARGGELGAQLANEESLSGVRRQLADSGLEHEVLQYTTSGRDAAEELVHLAEERGASTIVLGLRRRTVTGKFLFGSTAQRVLLDADVPVIAVKPAQ